MVVTVEYLDKDLLEKITNSEGHLVVIIIDEIQLIKKILAIHQD